MLTELVSYFKSWCCSSGPVELFRGKSSRVFYFTPGNSSLPWSGREHQRKSRLSRSSQDVDMHTKYFTRHIKRSEGSKYMTIVDKEHTLHQSIRYVQDLSKPLSYGHILSKSSDALFLLPYNFLSMSTRSPKFEIQAHVYDPRCKCRGHGNFVEGKLKFMKWHNKIMKVSLLPASFKMRKTLIFTTLTIHTVTIPWLCISP